MKLLVINGPNLNMLGVREPEIYGNRNYAALCAFIKEAANEVGASCEIYQSNHEGAIVDKIQEALGTFDAIVINPAAYTHTSVAIADALSAVALPTVEVHLSDVMKRESFRHHSFVAPVAKKTYMGLGFEGYKKAIRYLVCQEE
ncbi:MAG: type II 3-dehydroquinate dehydratase [Clostridia bacterium]|nr:type II 3-dehydroquinate dehydratase [Clostridia bacterium]